MTGGIDLIIALLAFAALVAAFLYFAARGTKEIYKSPPLNSKKKVAKVTKVEKYVVAVWTAFTIAGATIKPLQVIGAISFFFLFVYVVWLGVIRPTLP